MASTGTYVDPGGNGHPETRASAIFNGRLYVGVDASGNEHPLRVWCTTIDTAKPTNVNGKKCWISAKDATNTGVVTLASIITGCMWARRTSPVIRYGAGAARPAPTIG